MGGRTSEFSRCCGDCVTAGDRSGHAGRDTATPSNPAAPTHTNTTGDLAVTQPPHGYETRVNGAFPPTVAPADADGARRFVARTPAMGSVSALPIDRPRLSALRPPAWLIAPGSIRARDEARESARRSRLERWPKSMAYDGRLGRPSAHSTTAETPWQRLESRARGAGERSSGCHRSLAGVRRAPPPGAS